MSLPPAIAIRDLVKRYAPSGHGAKSDGGKLALGGVSFDVPQGGIFGLLGPNGAGKSTLINILAGLVMKTSGSASIWGFDIDSDLRNAKRSIGIVPQEVVFDAFFTPFEVLENQAGLYGVAKPLRRSMEILRAVHLEDKAHAYSRTLSGGMKRRLLIAKALVHAPPVLVLDEPTAGVDVELRQTLWGFIADLNKQGHTVLLTTHYLEEAEALCGRIAMLKQGRVVALDRTANLLAGTASTMLRFKTDQALPVGVAQRARVTGRVAQVTAHDAAEVETLLGQLRQAGVRVEDLEIGRADLEDVFLEIMQRETAA
jgi:ABC-2 type transport system ATP-binding protein